MDVNSAVGRARPPSCLAARPACKGVGVRATSPGPGRIRYSPSRSSKLEGGGCDFFPFRWSHEVLSQLRDLLCATYREKVQRKVKRPPRSLFTIGYVGNACIERLGFNRILAADESLRGTPAYV